MKKRPGRPAFFEKTDSLVLFRFEAVVSRAELPPQNYPRRATPVKLPPQLPLILRSRSETNFSDKFVNARFFTYSHSQFISIQISRIVQ